MLKISIVWYCMEELVVLNHTVDPNKTPAAVIAEQRVRKERLEAEVAKQMKEKSQLEGEVEMMMRELQAREHQRKVTADTNTMVSHTTLFDLCVGA